MRQDKFIRKSGPFKVSSISQDARGVRMIVYPSFPEYNLSEKERQNKDIDQEWKDEPRWAIQRLRNHNGGGPSIFTSMAMAQALEDFLNQPYLPEKVAEWKATLEQALEKIEKADQKRFERAMARWEQKNKA